MKRKKNLLIYSLLLLLVMGIYMKSPQTVSAANPQTVTLKANKTYTSYDITGDKKKDSIKINIYKKSSRDEFCNSLYIKINGKTAYSFTNKDFYEDIDIRLYTLKNGKPFLYLYAQQYNGDGPVCGVFQYKKGKLSQIINFQTLFSGYANHASGRVLSVKGNSITTQYSIMSFVLGSCELRYNYTYKNGTLKRSSSTTVFDKIYSYRKPTKTFYANKTLTAYTTASSNKIAFSVRPGNAVNVEKCYINGGKMFIKIKYNGKYGWMKVPKGYFDEKNQFFSNVTLAG